MCECQCVSLLYSGTSLIRTPLGHERVLTSEVFCTNRVFIEVSLFQGVPNKGFHCNAC